MSKFFVRVAIFLTILSLTIVCQQKPTLPDPLEAGWQGKAVCEEVLNNEKLRVLKCTFPPGVGHERHYHPEHFGYALAGGKFEITDETGTRKVEVLSGSHFYSEGTEWHEVLNIGDSTAVYLIIEPK